MFGLKEQHIIAINRCFEKYPTIELVIIYGSRAKGTFKNSSDIDLIMVGPEISDSQLVKIETELDDLLFHIP